MVEIIRTRGAGFDELKRAISKMQNAESKVGWLESDKYPNGTPVAYVAAIQEFGDPSHNIPPRSFMRSTAKEKETEWKEILFRKSKSVVKGALSIPDLMEIIGSVAAGDIRKTISEITSPPLKASTIKRKGFDKPLVDTRHMIDTLTNHTEVK